MNSKDWDYVSVDSEWPVVCTILLSVVNTILLRFTMRRRWHTAHLLESNFAIMRATLGDLVPCPVARYNNQCTACGFAYFICRIKRFEIGDNQKDLSFILTAPTSVATC